MPLLEIPEDFNKKPKLYTKRAVKVIFAPAMMSSMFPVAGVPYVAKTPVRSNDKMTSFKSQRVVENGFMPTFKVQGQVYHLAGSLLPQVPDDHKFLQIYFISDPEVQATTRCNISNSNSRTPLDNSIVRSLQNMLHLHNRYVQSFKTAMESISLDVPDYNVVIHASRVPDGEHRGRYNAPSTSEVAVVAGQQFDKRDIVLRSRDENLHKISELHHSYDSLQYPLMFCRGEDGYTIDIPQVNPSTGDRVQKKVSCMNYYCYRLMERHNHYNVLLRYGMLLNQYVVDQYAKLESERLAFIRNNQTQLRAENYIHLQDALHSNEHTTNNIGQLVILPSSFTGGPRYLHEKTQDAMTYVRNYGKPDLFITMTCNPNWKEIKDNLHSTATPQDRYDILNQLPDQDEDPTLYDIVVRNMIHGPCGALNPNSPCMHEGKCSKKFPKPYQSQTSTGDDGYPKYRRLSPEEGGRKAAIRSDQATFSLHSTNEVEQFQSGRYICSSEALWRIMSFNIHERAPTVTHLAVHLENGQRVYFTENNVNDIVNNPRDTTLTAFFKLCAEDDFAKTLTYDKVPAYYTWNQNTKKFQRRKQGAVVLGYPGVRKTDALGRVYVVHPNNAECFHLRLLLHVIKGPTSFRSLRTFEGVTYDTFQGACKAMGLLEDDSHWESTLSEAAICCSPKSLRCLFAIMISFCQITDPHLLWQNYQKSMSEDILQRRRQELSSDDLEYDQNIFDEALNELNKEVESLSGKSIKDFGFNLPLNSNLYAMNNIEDLRETDYDYTQLLQTIQDEHRLNPEQKIVYDQILSSVNSNEGKMFFLDAPGGTGKTFIINLLLAKARSDRKIALAVASSGIAATLLKGGRTAHSTFKLPLKICSDDVSSVCNISKQSKTGNGAFQSGNVKINLSNLCALVQNVEELVETVYPDITNITTKTLCWFKERAILAPTNEQVDKINHLIISKFEAPSQIYYSVDTVLDTAEAVHYPTEFLNSLVPPGIPPHKLILKVGSLVILLRNLNPPKLCNGTRLKIVKLKNFLIECTILTGCGTGDTVLIPRIPMIPSELPFQFKRLQFPIKLAFGITINKAQGQTLKVAGIDLTDQCFSHGQLYVALSRVTCKNNLFVFTNNPSEVMNVVYKEIFQ
ncbi:uncharacterized protein LOC123666107 [Melitaea cinxia]|uniref:uncharacterized protein LOC123666107 n=1 Tax=Melitaea cinxia TaxID=113334 RepID=UPI001E272F51|nr:uncharacterized protein LOC123666107 [Melitaea cinxia]